MQLNKHEVEALNKLLLNSKLDLPVHRRVVDQNGRNVSWLHKNIEARNEGNCREIKNMLNIQGTRTGKFKIDKELT